MRSRSRRRCRGWWRSWKGSLRRGGSWKLQSAPTWGILSMPIDLGRPRWPLRRLTELGELSRGRSRHRPRHAAHLYGGPYPFMQTGDVKASGGRISSYQQTYSEAGLAQSRMWPAGTLCITIAANIAETGILAFPACFPDSIVGFVQDETLLKVRYVELSIRSLKSELD